jgi:hypothetical protein
MLNPSTVTPKHRTLNVQTLNIVVVDFADPNPSSFIEAINSAYPQSVGPIERYATPEMASEAVKARRNFARIRTDPGKVNEIQRLFFLAPRRKEEPNAELIWEVLMEGAERIIVIVPDNNTQAQLDAKYLIQHFCSLAPVPFVVLVAGHDNGYIRQILDLPPDAPVIDYQIFDKDTLRRIVALL